MGSSVTLGWLDVETGRLDFFRNDRFGGRSGFKLHAIGRRQGTFRRQAMDPFKNHDRIKIRTRLIPKTFQNGDNVVQQLARVRALQLDRKIISAAQRHQARLKIITRQVRRLKEFRRAQSEIRRCQQ